MENKFNYYYYDILFYEEYGTPEARGITIGKNLSEAMQNIVNDYVDDDEEDMIKDILHLRVLGDCPGICLDIDFLDFVPDELNKN